MDEAGSLTHLPSSPLSLPLQTHVQRQRAVATDQHVFGVGDKAGLPDLDAMASFGKLNHHTSPDPLIRSIVRRR